VVSYDTGAMKLVMKVGDKEQTYELTANIRVHDVDGSDIKFNDLADKLRKGAKVDIEEKSGRIVAVNLKK